MTIPSQATRTTTRRRSSSRHVRPRIAVFFFWVILIFTQSCLSSSAEHNDSGIAPSGPSAPKKTRFFNSFETTRTPSDDQFVGSNGSGNGDHDNDSGSKLNEEDKRLVHTGPNPLHN